MEIDLASSNQNMPATVAPLTLARRERRAAREETRVAQEALRDLQAQTQAQTQEKAKEHAEHEKLWGLTEAKYKAQIKGLLLEVEKVKKNAVQTADVGNKAREEQEKKLRSGWGADETNYKAQIEGLHRAVEEEKKKMVKKEKLEKKASEEQEKLCSRWGVLETKYKAQIDGLQHAALLGKKAHEEQEKKKNSTPRKHADIDQNKLQTALIEADTAKKGLQEATRKEDATKDLCDRERRHTAKEKKCVESMKVHGLEAGLLKTLTKPTAALTENQGKQKLHNRSTVSPPRAHSSQINVSSPGASVFVAPHASSLNPTIDVPKENLIVFEDITPPSSPREVAFGAAFMFIMGKPGKDKDRTRYDALPCDDAIAATSNMLVVCDGVGEGGAASGELARQVVQATVSAFTSFTGQVHQDTLALIVSASRAESVKKVYSDSIGKASTTATVLALKDNGEGGRTRFSVDSVEIGDSQWALLKQNAADETWSVQYLSKDHKYPLGQTKTPNTPLQLNKGQDAAHFLQQSDKIAHSEPLEVGKNGHCRSIIVAGSDGLWDNFHNGDYEQLKTKLGTWVNDTYITWKERGSTIAFTSWLGNHLKEHVTVRMPSSTGKLDDVCLFVSAVVVRPCYPEVNVPRDKRLQEWMFASGDSMLDLNSKGAVLDTGMEFHKMKYRNVPQKELAECFDRYKTRLCNHYRPNGQMKSHCRDGDKCTYAHGIREMRCIDWTKHQPCRNPGVCLQYKHDNTRAAREAGKRQASDEDLHLKSGKRPRLSTD